MINNIALAASQTVNDGDAVKLASGKVTPCTSSDTQADFIVQESKTSGATDIVMPLMIAARRNARFKIGITPLHNEAAAVSGTSTTVVIAQSGYAGSELVGGVVYIKEQNAHRVISASSATSGGNITITFIEPLAVAPSAGNKVSTVPFGINGDPKFLAKNTIDTALANKTGGAVNVMQIDLKNKQLEVVFK
ncbi:MAG: hypothetical protein JSS82_15545 [Bacteroidetes bacterium]|nr:hypothetical protein [Bacteroidota bacterium]